MDCMLHLPNLGQLKKKKLWRKSTEPKYWFFYSVRQAQILHKVWSCQFDHQSTSLWKTDDQFGMIKPYELKLFKGNKVKQLEKLVLISSYIKA